MGSECDLGGFEQVVLETLKRCQQQNESTLVWVMEVAKCIRSLGVALPCLELGQVLVSQLCFDDNNSSLWKFVELALSSGLLYPLHVLSLLTSRILPHRRSQPKAYRLYLELLSRYAFSFNPGKADACKEKITKSVDVALQLSQLYRIRVLELGQAFVLFFFSMIIGLIDSTLDDWGLHMTPTDGPSLVLGSTDHHDMDIDFKGSHNVKGNEHHEKMRTTNSFTAIEVLGKLTESRKAMVILRLVHLNIGLLQRLQFLEASELVSPHLNSANQLLAKLSANIQRVMGFEYQLNRSQLSGSLLDIASCKPVSCFHSQFGQSACWAPFDIYMENAMDGKQLPIKSAVDVLTEAIKTLQAFNQASWQETFLALWLSALRLVQRERDPPEGPIPRLEARLCVLLSIVPLAITNVLEDEAKLCHSSTAGATFTGSVESGYGHKMNGKGCASRKDGLISSLQILGHFSGLLCPPLSVTDAANTAARKAASFITNAKNQRDIIRGGSLVDASIKAGYVSAPIISLSDSSSHDKSPWLMFMEGAPLNGSLIDYLIMNPASRDREVI